MIAIQKFYSWKWNTIPNYPETKIITFLKKKTGIQKETYK